jgi:hypothetical protein
MTCNDATKTRIATGNTRKSSMVTEPRSPLRTSLPPSR